MSTSLPRNIYPADVPKGVVKFLSVRLVPALDRTPTGWDFTISRGDPLHVRSDGQQIVPPVVVKFVTPVRDATGRVNGRGDLARMDRVFEDRRGQVDRAHPV